jgi:Ala-tRNA(Pro) deacylase
MTSNNCLDRLRGLLDERGARYELISHPHAETTQEAAAAGGISGYQFAKSVVVMVDGLPQLFVVPAAARVDLDAVRASLRAGSAAIAEEIEFEPLFPGCSNGAIPAIPFEYEMPVHIDTDLLSNSHIVFEAGSSTEAIRMATHDYMRVVQPMPGDFADEPRRRTGRRRRRLANRWEMEDIQEFLERTVSVSGVLATAVVGWRVIQFALPTSTMRTFAAGLAMGAAMAALMDPRMGARRRALMRDRSGRLMRRGGWWLSRKQRYWRGKAEGARHRLQPLTGRSERRAA